MLRKLLLALTIVLTTSTFVFSQSGTLKGKIADKETGEPIPFANIVIESGGAQMGGTTSDFDGNYTIKPITPGTYDVRATYVGYKPLLMKGMIIKSDNISFANLNLTSSITKLKTVEIVDYKVPLIEKDGGSSGGTVTSEEIEKMPGRSAESVATTVGGVFSKDGEVGSIRGARGEGTVMYIDGVRVRGSNGVPKAAIEQVTVLTGGLPAQYGDATGGIISVTTRGPSRQFGAGAELVTSQFLDNYGYNLAGFNVMGPLFSRKDSTGKRTTSLLGFFISGEIAYIKDPRPFATQQYKLKDDVLNDIETNPLRPSGSTLGFNQAGEFITMSDLEEVKSKQNSLLQSYNLQGKIDVRTTKNTNLTFGGSLMYNPYSNYNYVGSLYNWKNYGQVVNTTWRVFGRFTQRFPVAKDSKSPIKNVFYSIQADYSKYHQTFQDENHKDNLFNYGYIGKYTSQKSRSYEMGSDTLLGYENVLIHNNNPTYSVNYEKSDNDPNPILSNYTEQLYDTYGEDGMLTNLDIIQLLGGLLNGTTPKNIYDLWNNVGVPYNGYGNTNNAQFSINANGSADIKNHAIQFGLQYEQRIDRFCGYTGSSTTVGPAGLWTLMRQMTNKHIEQLDLANGVPVVDGNGVFQDTINYPRLYDASFQSLFDINLRQKLGLQVDGLDWIDIDNYDPSTFSIDMFSPDELFNNGRSYVTYYGYDYTGNVLKHKPSFDDFFTDTYEDVAGNMRFKREIGAFEPIYMAGYIQDKFAFNDLIFNIGLRVDRFDANQKVLKDPYLLYEAKTVKEVDDSWAEHPSNVGEDYVVYVNDLKSPTAILGYRDGSNWYNAQGAEIEDPSVLETPGGIAPYLVDPDQDQINSNSFADYEPQISYLPRISFSFPISDEALFFAHYDVLTKRPTSALRLDLLSYLYIENIGANFISNPNLKPEKTVDYELGFQQKLTNSSSLKLSTYYREFRDQIQAFRFSGAYPISYYSYNNIDFSTVKGMTITYDLRRTTNIWIKASYTLQFADGTGSSAASQESLIKSGQPNLRATNPLSFDQRHNITTVIDYRFADGKNYNGPKWSRREKGSDKVKTTLLLQNTGINFTFKGGSGTPYTKERIVGFLGDSKLVEGSINGSRLPWQFRIDARLDKDVIVKLGKGDETKKKKLINMNIYLQVLNLLNTKNIMGVYAATGNPDDDGFLADARSQAGIAIQTDEQAYREQYALRINSPYNYSLPRQIRIGAILSF